MINLPKYFGLLILLLYLVVSSSGCSNQDSKYLVKQPDNTNPYGLEPVDCWFIELEDWPKSNCYNMHVPENHTYPGERTITFPVVVFSSNSLFSSKPPVLHLGGGGPGAPMYLDFSYGVEAIWQQHDEISLKQGRDLFIIDPRGTGLSKPLLTCTQFVRNEAKRLEEDLPIRQTWKQGDRDMLSCIDEFKSQGVDFSTYNSLSIAQDIEILRESAGVEQWSLVGVSYGASYAQIIASEYPSSIESMILDSAGFPNIEAHHNYVEYSMSSYLALYNYCDASNKCKTPIEDFEKRFWNLHKKLNYYPLKLKITHPKGGYIKFVLNGDRFLGTVLEGVYGKKIFDDIPEIITELENGQYDSLYPYIQDYVAYLLEETWGDISAESHYCFEDKPYIDFELMKELTNELPEGYIRNIAKLSLDWPDFCDELNINQTDPRIAQASNFEVPTLFLHGELDTITPLSRVRDQINRFTNSRLVTYNLAHSILSADECAEIVAAKFIKNNKIEQDELNCH